MLVEEARSMGRPNLQQHEVTYGIVFIGDKIDRASINFPSLLASDKIKNFYGVQPSELGWLGADARYIEYKDKSDAMAEIRVLNRDAKENGRTGKFKLLPIADIEDNDEKIFTTMATVTRELNRGMAEERFMLQRATPDAFAEEANINDPEYKLPKIKEELKELRAENRKLAATLKDIQSGGRSGIGAPTRYNSGDRNPKVIKASIASNKEKITRLQHEQKYLNKTLNEESFEFLSIDNPEEYSNTQKRGFNGFLNGSRSDVGFEKVADEEGYVYVLRHEPTNTTAKAFAKDDEAYVEYTSDLESIDGTTVDVWDTRNSTYFYNTFKVEDNRQMYGVVGKGYADANRYSLSS